MVAHGSKAKQGILSELAMGRQLFSHFWESRTLSLIAVTWKDQHHRSKCFLLLRPALYTEHDAMWCRITLWSVGVSCLGCVPSRFLVFPPTSLLTAWVEWGAQKALALSKCCSAITKVSLGHQHCFSHKSKPQPHPRYCEEN